MRLSTYLVLLLILACTPVLTKEPTPTYTPAPLLTSEEAIGIVKSYLATKQVGEAKCAGLLGYTGWSAQYSHESASWLVTLNYSFISTTPVIRSWTYYVRTGAIVPANPPC